MSIACRRLQELVDNQWSTFYAEYQQRLTQASTLVSSLRKSIAERDKQISYLLQQAEGREKALCEKNEEIMRLRETAKQCSVYAIECEAKLRAALDEKAATENSTKALEDEVSSLSQKLFDESDKNDKLSLNLDGLRRLCDESIEHQTQMMSQLIEKQRVETDLKNELIELHRTTALERRNLEAKLKDLQEQDYLFRLRESQRVPQLQQELPIRNNQAATHRTRLTFDPRLTAVNGVHDDWSESLPRPTPQQPPRPPLPQRAVSADGGSSLGQSGQFANNRPPQLQQQRRTLCHLCGIELTDPTIAQQHNLSCLKR